MNTLIVYFDETKQNYQTVTPTTSQDGRDKFDGNWRALAEHVCPNFHSFEVV